MRTPNSFSLAFTDSSWPRFARHVEALARSTSAESAFEVAANAIVSGDIATLQRLLRENPNLARARSTRQHQATLLHYVAANGVEAYRQKTPKNVVEIATVLLDAGTNVNAEADVYGGGATTLELVATSIHPERAGVQESLLQLLLDRGASGEAAHRQGRNVVSACLANGRPQAAAFLAQHRFPLDLEAASGLGRLDLLQGFFDAQGNLTEVATKEQMQRGFFWASEYGRNSVLEFLLMRGVPVNADAGGQAALHWAVIGGSVETVRLLLSHGADLEMKNAYGGSALGQALWCVVHGDEKVNYIPVIEVLLNAGAAVSAGAPTWIIEQKRLPAGQKQRIVELLTQHAAAGTGFARTSQPKKTS